MSAHFDMTRGGFLVAAGALAAGPLAANALAHAKHGAFGGGDVGIVNSLLTFEKVEVEFYKRALAVPGLEPDVKKLLESISQNETDHAQSLDQALKGLGGKADPAPEPQFPDFANQQEAVRFGATLEDTAVWTYNGAATQIQSKDLLQAVASIAQVEARHAAALRMLDGKPPTEEAFDSVFSGEQADDAIHALTG